MLVKCRFLTYNIFWCNSQATLNATTLYLPLLTKATHPGWVPGSALSVNGYFHRISLSALQGYLLGVISVYQRKITPILFWQKNDTERCSAPVQSDATFPCKLRLHEDKYPGVANDMIRRKYPTNHKAVPSTQLGVAFIGRGVLHTVAQVEDLACERIIAVDVFLY